MIRAVRESERARRLVGDGVELRRHKQENYPLYADWYGDEEIWRLTSWTAKPMRRAAVEQLFDEREVSTVDDSFAIHREDEEKPLGVIGLTNISEEKSSADLTVIVGSVEDRNKGLGTAAIRAILRYAFEDLGLERVSLSVFEFNEPAIHAYEKLGFKREGRMQRAIQRDGAVYDVILMRMLADEWRAAYGEGGA